MSEEPKIEEQMAELVRQYNVGMITKMTLDSHVIELGDVHSVESIIQTAPTDVVERITTLVNQLHPNFEECIDIKPGSTIATDEYKEKRRKEFLSSQETLKEWHLYMTRVERG